MQASLRHQIVASRFELFVQDLHSLLEDCLVPYGSPEHLARFGEELTRTKGPLRSGIRSSVRRTLLQVQGPVSHGELIESVLVAVGGVQVEEDAAPAQRIERALSPLVGEAMISPLQSVPALPGNASVPDDAADSVRVVATPDETFEAGDDAQQSRPEGISWAPPPAYVWAALVCGALLAPGMYLLSRPHAAPAAASQAAHPLPTHRVVHWEPAPVTEFAPWSFVDPLSTPPKHTNGAALTKRPSTHASKPSSTMAATPRPLQTPPPEQ